MISFRHFLNVKGDAALFYSSSGTLIIRSSRYRFKII